MGDEPAEEPVHQSSAPIVKPLSQSVPIVKPVIQPVRRPTEPATVVSPVVEKEEEVGTKKLSFSGFSHYRSCYVCSEACSPANLSPLEGG